MPYIAEVALKQIEEVMLVDEIRETHISIILITIEQKHPR
jgi:hypothetical protein